MHKFITSSGKQLWYNVKNNRISLFSPDNEKEACPVTHFNQPTYTDGYKITKFTIEMTQQCNLSVPIVAIREVTEAAERIMRRKSLMKLLTMWLNS